MPRAYVQFKLGNSNLFTFYHSSSNMYIDLSSLNGVVCLSRVHGTEIKRTEKRDYFEILFPTSLSCESPHPGEDSSDTVHTSYFMKGGKSATFIQENRSELTLIG